MTELSHKKNSSTVWWWIGWIALTIASFFVSYNFWTGFIAKHVGSMDRPGVPILWVTAVFGSWMVLLVPLIIVMYNKVDRAYEDARIARESVQFQKAKEMFGFKSIFIDESQRKLKDELSAKLKRYPETIKRGHLVTAILKDGESVPNVFVLDKKEILGIYGVNGMDFQVKDVVDIEPVPVEKIPDFKTEGWLRLDGIGN